MRVGRRTGYFFDGYTADFNIKEYEVRMSATDVDAEVAGVLGHQSTKPSNCPLTYIFIPA